MCKDLHAQRSVLTKNPPANLSPQLIAVMMSLAVDAEPHHCPTTTTSHILPSLERS